MISSYRNKTKEIYCKYSMERTYLIFWSDVLMASLLTLETGT
jgi:hypothetical protein